MRKETKRWVQYYTPGSFVAETWTEDISHLDPEKIKWPKEAYAFQLYEREDVIDGQTRYTGNAKSIGPMYYHPDSKIETLAEVKRNPKATEILIDNMRCNGWKKVVWTRWGNWPQPYETGDIAVLPAKR